MKAAGILVCFSCLLPLVGTVRRSVPLSRVRPLEIERLAQNLYLRSLLSQGTALFRSGKITQACSLYESSYEKSVESGEREIAAQLLGNIGSCRFAEHDYERAIEYFQAARAEFGRLGDRERVGTILSNVASIYEQLGRTDPAIELAQASLDGLRRGSRPLFFASVQILLGTLYAQKGNVAASIDSFRRGIEEADRIGDRILYTIGLTRLGREYLLRRRFEEAEECLLEAFRIYKLNRLPPLAIEGQLGLLLLEQGDLRSASALLDEAVRQTTNTRGLPAWYIYDTRGRIRMAQGRYAEAVEDLAQAVRLGREWRRAVPHEDATRVSMEGLLQKAHSRFVQAGNHLYFQHKSEELAQQTFAAAEENRAASLRALLGVAENLDSLEPAELIRKTTRNLDRDSAYLSFLLGDEESYLWAVSRSRFALHRLPGRAALADAIRNFRAASHDAPARAHTLYSMLFGQLGREFLATRRWLLALDEDLFDIPTAALVTRLRKGRRKYLAEAHAVQVVSGAHLLSARSGSAFRGPFLGVGDPVYNRADSRWQRMTAPRTAAVAWTSGQEHSVELVRLPGTGREIELCAREWMGWSAAPFLLRGPRATRAELRIALGKSPAVIHFATHVVEVTGPPRQGAIALSIDRSGTADLLETGEIARWRVPSSLVVISGCSSGNGDVLPGTGLMGLTRSWLAAGAAGVVASHWPTPDDSGGLFLSFYRHLRTSPGSGPAVALQQAQNEMLAAGDWRSAPRYWGAYFLVANR